MRRRKRFVKSNNETMNKVERNNETTMNKVESNMMQLRSSSADSIVIRGCLGSWPPRYRSACKYTSTSTNGSTCAFAGDHYCIGSTRALSSARDQHCDRFWHIFYRLLGGPPKLHGTKWYHRHNIIEISKKQWLTFRNYLLSKYLYWYSMESVDHWN